MICNLYRTDQDINLLDKINICINSGNDGIIRITPSFPELWSLAEQF